MEPDHALGYAGWCGLLYRRQYLLLPLCRNTAFLKRVAGGTIAGYSSVHVLAEAIHKIMLAEAAATFGLNRAGLVNWLQRHGNRITELHEFRRAAGELLAMGLNFVPIDGIDLQHAADLSRKIGLLTNGATTLALIQRHTLSHLVTNDNDFDSIPNLTIWKPR